MKQFLIDKVLGRLKAPEFAKKIANVNAADVAQLARDEAMSVIRKMFYKYFLLMNLTFGVAGLFIGFIAGIAVA